MSVEKDPAVLKFAMMRGLRRRSSGHGEIVWPAVPSMLDQYVEWLSVAFHSLGRKFSEAEVGDLRNKLRKHLEAAFAGSPHSKVTIEYHTEAPPDTSLAYTISHQTLTIIDEYSHWVESRKPPLFGENPDAKVMQVAASIGDPADVSVLDIGAGTGRNTLPLARSGFQVDAIEISPELANILRSEAARSGLNVTVLEGDALDPATAVPKTGYHLIILAEVVSHFRTVEQIRVLFDRAAEWLSPGGTLLLNAFLWDGENVPDYVRDMSQVMWSSAFTAAEIASAAEGTPFLLTSDESVHDFERQHLPPTQWPPTGWFPEWTKGLDVFEISPERSPLELRWLEYRSAGEK